MRLRATGAPDGSRGQGSSCPAKTLIAINVLAHDRPLSPLVSSFRLMVFVFSFDSALLFVSLRMSGVVPAHRGSSVLFFWFVGPLKVDKELTASPNTLERAERRKKK